MQDNATPLDVIITSLVIMQDSPTPLEDIITSLGFAGSANTTAIILLGLMQDSATPLELNNFFGYQAGNATPLEFLISSLVRVQDANTTGGYNNFFGLMQEV